MNELIIIGACAILGFVIAVVGLTWDGPEVTHKNRAKIARAYFDHVTEEVQDE